MTVFAVIIPRLIRFDERMVQNFVLSARMDHDELAEYNGYYGV